MYQTLETVFDGLFDYILKKFKVQFKITPPRVVFLTLFSLFGNVVKHGLSCLFY